MKASTYCGLVIVDIAVVQCDCAAVDVDATSALPNNRRKDRELQISTAPRKQTKNKRAAGLKPVFAVGT